MKQSIFTFLICLAIISFTAAQDKTDTRKWYQDTRMMNIGPVDVNAGEFQNPYSQLNYINKNTSVMVQKTTDGSAIVYPSFRVHPSTFIQSEVPIVTHPTNKNIIYGSSNSVRLSPTLFISEGVYVTSDGGSNWSGSDTTNAEPLTDHGGDPAPSIDMNGIFYQSYLSFNNAGLWVTNSTNNGNTWSNATKILAGSQDKNHTFTINNPSSPYNGRTFVIWSRFTVASPCISVSYTTNNGLRVRPGAQSRQPGQRVRPRPVGPVRGSGTRHSGRRRDSAGDRHPARRGPSGPGGPDRSHYARHELDPLAPPADPDRK